ncbi:hypothetical protein [Accumulibacter sp.]|uniref:hypothetical protein n=1 Tax=Accumulibacter sp. TaxID=2053492 RepID=UPI0025F76F9D|nr:hypothetical protein [Accumulibacter sp.]
MATGVGQPGVVLQYQPAVDRESHAVVGADERAFSKAPTPAVEALAASPGQAIIVSQA